MQTLWNRIVQTKCACKCSSCFSSIASCTRRTTTAVFRSRITSRDRFTVLSSSFLTAATLIDSDIKARKRRKLLGEIEDAKNELKALDASQNRRLAALSIEDDNIKEPALSEHSTWDDVLKWAQEEKRIRHALGLEGWKGIPLSILESFSTNQLRTAFLKNANLRNLVADLDLQVPSMPWWSMKRQKTIEWSSAKLAYLLSREVYKLKVSDELDNVSGGADKIKLPLLVDIQQANKMLSKLHQIAPNSAEIEQALSPPAPRYTLNYRLNKENAATLISSLDEVFRFCRAQEKSLQYLLINICHHLLTSDVPPTIETFLLLAKNFEELREYRLVQLVFDAVRNCKFRLDKEALTFFLDFYAKTRNREGFRYIVSRIHGFGNGLGPEQTSLSPDQIPCMIPGIAFDKYRFGKRKIRSSSKSSNCENFNAAKNDLSNLKHPPSERMVLRVVLKGQAVYTSLIRGTLKFFDDLKAMGHYVDLIREGHEPTVEMLTAILHRCCDRRDWRSGLRVSYEIQTIAGANLHIYRWILQLCHKIHDKEAFKTSLAGGIRRGIISPAVQYFPEQIEAMDVDLLLDLAKDYDELLQEVESEKTSSKLLESLTRRLEVISDQMAETAFEFGSLMPSCGLSPTKRFFLYTRITYHGASLSRWAARKEYRTSENSHNILDISSRNLNALAKAPSGVHEVLRDFELPRFLKANSSVKNYVSRHTPRKHASPWYPLLQILADTFRNLRRRLHKLAQDLGDIELSIRHGPTVGHLLEAKMLLLWAEPLDFVRWTEQRSSRTVYDWVKEDSCALQIPQGLEEERSRPKKPADQANLPDDDRRLLQWEQDEQFHSETQREAPDFGKRLSEARKVKGFSSELTGILPETVQVENILNI